MNLKQLFNTDDDTDRGVSPVIGVILMVAITVILAAVIGAFVLGLGDQVSNNAPQASFQFDFEGTENVTITHGGGDDIENSSLSVTIDGESPGNVGPSGFDDVTPWSGTVSTGSIYEIKEGASGDAGIEGGETVRIIWSNPSGGSSNTIGERDWPS